MNTFFRRRDLGSGLGKLLATLVFISCGMFVARADDGGGAAEDIVTLEPIDEPLGEEDRQVIDEIFGDPVLRDSEAPETRPPEPPVLSELAQGVLGEPEVLEDAGVLLYRTQLPGVSQLWIYVPREMPPTAKVPLVLISPAGSEGYHGMDLTPADQPEHIPYAQAGMVTAAFSTPGSLPDGWTEEQRREAVNSFHASGKGVRTARGVMNYVVRLFPQINPHMVFAAGHSSAGSLALTLGAYQSSLRGILAYAPSTNLRKELGELAIEIFDNQIPGFAAFTRLSSPLSLAKRITSPVFIYQARDDRVIDPAGTTEFVEKLRVSNPSVTFLLEPEGGHYQGMLDQGIPAGIQWIDDLTNWRDLPANQMAEKQE
jgi:pimeloyl-ACP methyl ester carboxylesterase